MITLRFGPAALAHVRFAISPLVEARRSLRVLDDPGARAPCTCRGRSRRARLTADLDLSLLRALDPTGVYTPDFVSPPPDRPAGRARGRARRGGRDAARAGAWPRSQRSYRRKPPLPPVLEPFVADPAAGVADGRRPAARLLGARAGPALAAPARAARGRRAASRAPDGRRRRRAPVRRRRPDRQLGRRRAEHRQAQRRAGRRPRAIAACSSSPAPSPGPTSCS